MVDNLAGILAGPGRAGGPGRNPVLHTPDTDEMAGLTDRARRASSAPTRSATWPSSTTAQLADLAGRLRELENRVSAERRGLHERIDTLQAELVERHKSGRASVDGLLS